jgi:hypothetical protein
MIEEGRYEGTIIENALRITYGGTMYADLLIQIGEDQMHSRIWLSYKALKHAKPSLLRCGFDIDKRDLEELNQSKLLHGVKIPVVVEEREFNGKTELQCSIDSSPKLEPAQIKKMQDALRKVKLDAKEEPFKATDDDIPF